MLAVDDERALAETVAEALETEGHTAAMAENGSVALEMLERRTYDLIISDGKTPVLADLVRLVHQMLAAPPR